LDIPSALDGVALAAVFQFHRELGGSLALPTQIGDVVFRLEDLGDLQLDGRQGDGYFLFQP
jgi:hypothetical protein